MLGDVIKEGEGCWGDEQSELSEDFAKEQRSQLCVAAVCCRFGNAHVHPLFQLCTQSTYF